jgi:hypothetical protein
VSIDAFEHFGDPGAILEVMRGLLKPDGCVFAAFGPTWYHPLGGHTLSVFPWAHFVFTEKALLRWRNSFKQNQTTRLRFSDEGLNQMTIRRFERLVSQSPFQFAALELIPIRKLRLIANRLTREVTTSVVRCKLILRGYTSPKQSHQRDSDNVGCQAIPPKQVDVSLLPMRAGPRSGRLSIARG